MVKKRRNKWDINRLAAEQTILQPVHEKHIKDSVIFTVLPRYVGTGAGRVNMMDLNDRIRYGCVMMGYNYNNGTFK